jgi:uracil-DNA glycosylase
MIAGKPVSLKGARTLLADVRACKLCASYLPLGPRPVLQVHPAARILIAGQAPGSRVHATGVPFDDPSGDRLRDWMGIDEPTFYDAARIAILPMGFCFPGTGNSGDLPPRPECAPTWRDKLLATMPDIRLTLVIGQYAQAWHMKGRAKATLTETALAWRDYGPTMFPLPHPSPRNNIWLKRNP